VKYRAATTTAPIKKFENAKPAGTNTSIYRCASNAARERAALANQ
jgi:hypothetical protein